MQILMLSSTYPRWSGDAVPSFVSNLAEDLVANGVGVTVVAPHSRQASRTEIMGGVEVVRFRYSWPARIQKLAYDGGVLANLRRRPWTYLEIPGFVLLEGAAVRKLLRTGRFDLIHSHWLIPQGLVAQRIARGFQVPHVATAHGSDVFGLGSWPLRAAKSWVINNATRVTVNSEATNTKIRELSERSVGVVRIPMGVQLNESEGGRPPATQEFHRQGPALLFVGRLVEMKGVEFVLRALTSLAARHPNVRLAIAGDGPDRKRLETLSVALGIADRVTFLGWVRQRDLPELLEQADVFVAPSTTDRNGSTEAQGVVLLEAMAHGVPVIGTSLGGIPEVVSDGDTGLIVPDRDPVAIARAVERLVSDRSLARRVTRRARRLVESEYSRETTARRFIQLYGECLGGVR